MIILTGHGSEADRETCMKLGAFAYLQKPVDIEVLSETLKQANEKVQQAKDRRKDTISRSDTRDSMTVWKKLKPEFWDYVDAAAGPFAHLFNFRRMWQLAVLLTVGLRSCPLSRSRPSTIR